MTAERTGDPERNETAAERADRRWNETLQEVRVAQTGAQILFGFLLSVAFTPRFQSLSRPVEMLYVVAVALGALATGTLIAPVAYHRLLAGRHLKPELVDAVGRLVSVGVILLALAVNLSVLLLLLVATDNWLAWLVTSLITLWFTLCWLVFPVLLLRSGGRRAS
ncbi:DUF6328 family protein [Streptomyces sp. NRRL S-87]|uniref:DUF6328 family protein n=1 Tax=Streptomyces sp. NRRL S-87 TaxID=1463920 RepID=UPI0004BF5390|nr:DUF6328 family protein [Streptomyces sp. NRRL S-87]